MPVGELQAYLNAQPKMLTENLTITVSGTLNQTLGIPHFYGPCTLHIQAAERGGCTFQKGVTIRGEKIRFTNCLFSNNGAETHLDYECEAHQHVMLNLYTCDFAGNGKGSAIVVHDFGKIIATSCTIKHYNRAVTVTYGGMAVIGCDKAEDTQNNSDGAYLWKGGIVIINPGTDPLLGGAAHSKQGGIIILPNGTLA